VKLTIDGEVYDFDMTRITNVEGMAIEKVTGKTYVEWAEAMQAGSMLAVTALVWIVRKRQEPTLQFEQVEFSQISMEDEEAVSPLEDPVFTGADSEEASAATV
jgi:hypothetical protein